MPLLDGIVVICRLAAAMAALDVACCVAVEYEITAGVTITSGVVRNEHRCAHVIELGNYAVQFCDG